MMSDHPSCAERCQLSAMMLVDERICIDGHCEKQDMVDTVFKPNRLMELIKDDE